MPCAKFRRSHCRLAAISPAPVPPVVIKDTANKEEEGAGASHRQHPLHGWEAERTHKMEKKKKEAAGASDVFAAPAPLALDDAIATDPLAPVPPVASSAQKCPVFVALILPSLPSCNFANHN